MSAPGGHPPRPLAIQTASLRKTYAGRIAVADLTLGVPAGEVFGFLGPNGAGKSTAVKMLLGLVHADGGSASVLGRPVGDPAARQRVGFLPEHFRFHEWLGAAEFLDLHARLYRMDSEVRKRRIPELLDRVGLADQARRPLAGFSKGMLQRVGLAQALLNEPELLFLDEPTSALDPFGRILVREIIHELRSRGTTVFLNSHLLGEVEATCDRVCFIREGRVLQTLALGGLEAGLLQVELRVDAVTPALRAGLKELAVEWRAVDGRPDAAAPGGDPREGTTLEITLRDEELVPVIAERTLASGARLYALTPRRLSLEQLFVQVVGAEGGAR
ncbi:MAG: ABC transporter ATP-binding protein [Gemmatimonadetes bacterium]|nr:ABC transporter ATP-binding protein [Gemmatimonadota bacterium]